MKRYRYYLDSPTFSSNIWCSFDTGKVMAKSIKQATKKAKGIISFQLKHVNELLYPYATIGIDINQLVVVLDEDQTNLVIY